jgi:hypothetical protein
MKITRDSDSINGNVFSTPNPNPPKVSFNYNAGSVDISIGLPGIHLFGDSWLYAAPVFTIGAGVYDLKFTDRKTGDSTTYSGSGPMIGGGFGSTIMNARCPWFGGFDVL